MAEQYQLPPEFDTEDVGSYLRWQFGIYRHLGMNYEEFWLKDYRLVESYRIKNELDRQREERNAYVFGRYNFEGMGVIASHMSKKNSTAAYPKEPHPATEREVEEKQRDAKINRAFNHWMQTREERRRKRDGT